METLLRDFGMSKSEKSQSRFANYKRPPVREVVFGIRFEPLKEWKLPHVGAFWTQVLDDFPRCEHAIPIGAEQFLDEKTGLILPRVWLISGSDDRLIQLQPGRFLFNWRFRQEAGPYPHYVSLSKTFFDLLQTFKSFCDKNQLGDISVREYELTYINHVEQERGWTFPQDIGKVVEAFSWNEKKRDFLPSPVGASWQTSFELPDSQGNLLIKLNTAERTADDKRILLLELLASGIPPEAPLDNMENWFELANEWIDRGFEDITSEKVQQELWGKYE